MPYKTNIKYKQSALLLIKIIGLVGLLGIISWKEILKSDTPQGTIRKSININQGWKYLENNTTSLLEAYKATTWNNISLPHTWNQWDVTDPIPGYRRDGSWYKKTMRIDAYNQAKYQLYFEGSNISTSVYVNGKLAGTHVGGYVGFRIDITPYVLKGKSNTIAIRVDNCYNPDIIPSQKADFFIYGGITRDLWLEILPDTHIIQAHISTPSVSKAKGVANIKLNFSKKLTDSKSFIIRSTIKEKNSDKIVASEDLDKLTSDDQLSFNLPDINNPKLWSPDEPNLYSINIKLIKNGKLIDEINETYGYRWFRFDDYGAFYINDERLLLRGTHRHEEYAGYGAAMPNDLHRKDIEQIKEMGANFIRLAHYPQDPEVYKACNELGLIVWDELPWCRGGMGGRAWQDNTKRLLVEQINQSYNHPSILFWSLGNEMYWLPDFEGGDEVSKMNTFVKSLNDLSHKLDPRRMTAIRKYYDGAELVDVFSPSIWSGWYAGIYTSYGETLTKNQKLYKRFLHMEYGGSSHIGRHTETPITGNGLVSDSDWAEVSNQVNVANIAQNGDWSENYIVDLFDWYLNVSEHQPGFAGNAQWAFKDFATPLRPENPMPYMNQKGLVDREGRPKDAFYVFKSHWAKKPFVYIESHSWTERQGPEDKKREVCVFSNTKEVTMWHNGVDLGRKIKKDGVVPSGGLTWPVMFVEGNNSLKAIGYQDGSIIASDSMMVNYTYKKAGTADYIALKSKKLSNGNYLVEALVYDKNHQRVLDYESKVFFSHDGAGKLMIDYGVPDKSQVIAMANGRAAIQIIPGKGKAVIEVRNQDFKGTYLNLDFSSNLSTASK